MLQSNKTSEYNRLFEQYNKKSNEELSEIANPEGGYTDVAKRVASDILQSDRTEYYKNIKQQEYKIEEEQKIDKDRILLKLSNDIHSIKNMLLFFVILTVLGLIFGFYAVFITVPNLF